MLFLFLAVTCIFLIYKYTTRNHDYWAKKNVKHERPLPFFGNHLKSFFGLRSAPEIGIEMLNKFKGEKIIGYYRGITPELFIRDPEIVKHILSLDFKNFVSRGLNENTKKDPLLHNLVFAKAEEWRVMRQELTPAFTLSKIQKMSPQILKCIDDLETVLKLQADRREVVSAYDMMVGYTIQCIGSCAFGVEFNTTSEQTQFFDLAKKFFVKTKPQMLLVALTEMYPQAEFLFNYLKIIDDDLENMLMEITRHIYESKKLNPNVNGNKDFMDIFVGMAAKRFGQNNLEMDAADKEAAILQFTAAQLFFFLFAGFETTATSMAVTLHYLAQNLDIQRKIQKQIDSVLSKTDNNLMESIEELTQLDMAFKESMRLLTPIGAVRRICSDTYTIPGTDVTIDKGIKITIPIQALHLDPGYYENPYEFRPERFSMNAEKIPSHQYLAFGEGQRKCIGSKLAMKISLTGLATVLHRYTVLPGSPKTELSVKKTSFLAQIVDGGVPVKFVPKG